MSDKTRVTALPMPKYGKPEARRAFYDELLRRVEEIPGVESAGVITFMPLSFSGMKFSFSVEGRTNPSDVNLPFAFYRVVSPDYFRALEIPLQRGRFFDSRDAKDSPPVMVVNRRLAEQFWPGEDPTGKRLKIGPVDSPNPWAVVIGRRQRQATRFLRRAVAGVVCAVRAGVALVDVAERSARAHEG